MQENAHINTTGLNVLRKIRTEGSKIRKEGERYFVALPVLVDEQQEKRKKNISPIVVQHKHSCLSTASIKAKGQRAFWKLETSPAGPLHFTRHRELGHGQHSSIQPKPLIAII